MDASRGFTVAHAHTLGWSRADLRAAEYAAPARGARVRHSVGDRADDLFEALRALARDDQFFSHTTAARIHRIAIPWRLRHDDVHLASPSFTSRMRRPGVRGHRVKSEVVLVDGLRVESVADTLVHLGSMLTVDELVAACESVVRDAGDLAALVARSQHYRGARGSGVLHRALGRVRVGAESPAETRTRLLIVDGGLPEPVCQFEVFDPNGTFVARLDLAWPRLRLAVEYDGEQHRTDARQYGRDIERHRSLERLGWQVIRVTRADFHDRGASILRTIREAYRLRASR